MWFLYNFEYRFQNQFEERAFNIGCSISRCRIHFHHVGWNLLYGFAGCQLFRFWLSFEMIHPKMHQHSVGLQWIPCIFGRIIIVTFESSASCKACLASTTLEAHLWHNMCWRDTFCEPQLICIVCLHVHDQSGLQQMLCGDRKYAEQLHEICK